MKNIAILGSTGSIGTQTLDVVRDNKNRFNITVLTCGKNIDLLEKQISEFNPDMVSVLDEQDALKIKSKFPKLDIAYGENGLIQAAEYNSDMVLNSLMGMRGLIPTYHAILKGKDIALANKETLVAGGDLIIKATLENGVKILPVDSEHSAIFQCLQGNNDKKIKRILLTASGGPFRGFSLKQLGNVKLEDALRHPKWTMGQKITIDSATMMNKGLEVIEARWLFDVDIDDIEILVHPQSIVHSAVEFEDTSVIAQMGMPDMRIPISVALGYPDRLKYNGRSLNFFEKGFNLSFEEPDTEVFKCIEIARYASKMGGSYPVAMNGANEVLVDQFLKGKIKFIDIQNFIKKILEAHNPTYNLGLNDVIEIDKEIRKATVEMVSKKR